MSGLDLTEGSKGDTLWRCAYNVRFKAAAGASKYMISPIAVTYSSGSGTFVKNAIEIDFSHPFPTLNDTDTIRDYLLLMGWTEEELAAIPRITKEEFYSLT